MTKVSDIFHGSSLKTEDLKGKQVSLTIESWSVVDFDDGKKIELRFTDTDRTFVLNKTNSNTIADLLGTDDLDGWRGAKVTIGPEKTDFNGKRVDCIRVQGASLPKAVVSPNPEAEEDDIPF